MDRDEAKGSSQPEAPFSAHDGRRNQIFQEFLAGVGARDLLTRDHHKRTITGNDQLSSAIEQAPRFAFLLCVAQKDLILFFAINIFKLCAAHMNGRGWIGTIMSDSKPRRPGREPGRPQERREIAPSEPVPSDTVPTIAPETRAPPEAVEAPPVIVDEPVRQPEPESVEPVVAKVDDAWAALTQVQTARARGLAEIAAEMTGITRSSVAVATDAAVAMLGARTLADAVEINAGMARRGADALIEGSAKLSEIGVTAMTEATRPILSRLGTSWSGPVLRKPVL
jgi:hypothetical protein